VRHARADALEQLVDLLTPLRGIESLRERTPGSFYHKSSSCLHFHEDPSGLFADLKVGRAFERFEVTTLAQRQELLGRVDRLLQSATEQIRA
jgi:hypothetical protein